MLSFGKKSVIISEFHMNHGFASHRIIRDVHDKPETGGT